MDYKIIIKVLKKDYGWDGFDTLHDIQKELINDVVSATEKETIKRAIPLSKVKTFILKALEQNDKKWIDKIDKIIASQQKSCKSNLKAYEKTNNEIFNNEYEKNLEVINALEYFKNKDKKNSKRNRK